MLTKCVCCRRAGTIRRVSRCHRNPRGFQQPLSSHEQEGMASRYCKSNSAHSTFRQSHEAIAELLQAGDVNSLPAGIFEMKVCHPQPHGGESWPGLMFAIL